MLKKIGLMMVVCLLAAVSGAFAADMNVADYMKQGETQLRSGEFKDALRSFGEAYKLDRSNETCRSAYLVLRQVIKARQVFDTEQNLDKWKAVGESLRRYYYQHQVYGEALKADALVYEKEATTANALKLAESQLMNGKNAEAAALLSKQEELGAEGKILMALAKGRLGQADEAKSILSSANYEGSEPAVYFVSACAKASIDDQAGALADLTKCFETTPPSSLKYPKASALACDDFNAYKESDAFAQVMATESKINESDCSGGSSCGSCQLKGSCSSGN